MDSFSHNGFPGVGIFAETGGDGIVTGDSTGWVTADMSAIYRILDGHQRKWRRSTPASSLALALSIFGMVAALLPRFISAARFRQPLLGAIQWFAFFRALRNRPVVWRGRSYFQPNLDSSDTYVHQN